MQPIKTSSISEARTLAERDGAVILDQVGASADDAKSVMQALLGTGLLALPEPARVFDGGEQDRWRIRPRTPTNRVLSSVRSRL